MPLGPEGGPIRECLVAGFAMKPDRVQLEEAMQSLLHPAGPPPMERTAGIGDTARKVAVKAEGVNGFPVWQRLTLGMWKVTSLCTLWGTLCGPNYTKCLHSFFCCPRVFAAGS